MSTNTKSLIANRYQLLEKLGQGGMGAVYKAKDRLTGSTIALKQVLVAPIELEFNSRMSTDTDVNIALAREFQTLASLRHPNIISVLDYGYMGNRLPFFTMEYLEASDSFQVAGNQCDLEGKVDLLIQLLQALAYLHRRNIVHRDLKPANVMVVDGKVKTLDFGLAVVRSESIKSLDKYIGGTLRYMAPELFNGGTATTVSDMWSVGIMAYQLFTRRHPFDTSSKVTLLRDVILKEVEIDGLDLPPALKNVIRLLLMKTPEARYDNAFTVIDDLYQAIGKDTPKESIEYRESFIQAAKFVGRKDELSCLKNALNDATQGQGAGFLIGGESGVGKSRLIDELRSHALVKDVTVLRGQAVEGGGLAFQLWRDVLRRMILSVELNTSQKQILKEIVPDIGTLLGETVRKAPKLSGKAGIERLIMTIIDIFRSHTQPTLLVLEDLQWATESIAPLHQLMRYTNDLPLLIVGTYRNDETPTLPETFNTMNLIELQRLDEKNIAKLSQSMLGDVGTQPEIVEILTRETEGNCFFMVEVVRVLAEEAGRLTNIGQTTLPTHIISGGIQQVVKRRITRLPESIQSWLKSIAVAGRHLDFKIIDQLNHMMPTQTQDHSIDDILLQCSNVAVLEIANGGWRFSHDKIREALLTELSNTEQPRLHQQVAEAIETVYPQNDDYNEVLLEHWQQANNLPKTLDYAINVLGEFLRTGRSLEAKTLALQIYSQLLASPNQAQQQEVQLLQFIGDSYYKLSDYELARQHYADALTIAEAINNIQLQAEALLGLHNVIAIKGDMSERFMYIEEALDLFRQVGDERGIAKALHTLSRRYVSIAELDNGEKIILESLKITETLNDPYLYAQDLSVLALIKYDQRELDEAHKLFDESLEIKQEINDLHGIVESSHDLINTLILLKAYDKAKALIEEMISLNKRLGNQLKLAECFSQLGSVAYYQKQYTLAENYKLQAIDIWLDLDQPRLVTVEYRILGDSAFSQEKFQKALGYYQQTIDLAQKNNLSTYAHVGHCLLIHTYLRIGEFDKAHALIPITLPFMKDNENGMIIRFFLYRVIIPLRIAQANYERAGIALGATVSAPNITEAELDECDKLNTQLNKHLPANQFDTLIERGKSLDLDTIIQELFDEFGDADEA